MTDSAAQSVGVVGAGVMGGAIATRLIETGHRVRAFDLNAAKVAVLVAKGAAAAACPREAADGDFVILSLNSAAIVERAVFGPDGVAEAGKAGKLLIDMSSIDPESTRAFAARLEAMNGMRWLDCPLSGGAPGALAGRLAVMAGGSQADFERARLVMASLSRNYTLMGEIGAGQTTKLVNQVLCAIGFQAVAEAVALAERGGVAAERIPAALAGGRADSAILQEFGAKMARRDYAPTGRLDNMVKDLDGIQALARAINTAKSGAAVVRWHSGTKPGPEPEAGIFANVTTSPQAVSDTAAYEAIADSNGEAGVVIFTDTQYEIAVFKARAMEAAIKKCGGCTVLEFVDSPIAESSQRMPQLTTTLLQKYGDKWTYSLAINDLYFDFMGPSLAAAGKKGDGAPKAISAGDGSESAFQRIRAKQYKAGTVPEPLNEQGWQLVDEPNRAFNKAPWSGFVSGIHPVTPDSIAFAGGPKNIFDPDNGYRDQYKKIWSAM